MADQREDIHQSHMRALSRAGEGTNASVLKNAAEAAKRAASLGVGSDALKSSTAQLTYPFQQIVQMRFIAMENGYTSTETVVGFNHGAVVERKNRENNSVVFEEQPVKEILWTLINQIQRNFGNVILQDSDDRDGTSERKLPQRWVNPLTGIVGINLDGAAPNYSHGEIDFEDCSEHDLLWVISIITEKALSYVPVKGSGNEDVHN
jgi:hypothetical protein